MDIKRLDKYVSKGYVRNPKKLSDKIRLVTKTFEWPDGPLLHMYGLEVYEDGQWCYTETKRLE